MDHIVFRPRWVPSLDAPVGESGKSQPANGFAWFERTVFYAARVLNASSVGSQISILGGISERLGVGQEHWASSRPDFNAIVYPGGLAAKVIVPKNAPPAFLICADNDPSHVVATVNLYLALQKQGVSSEMHIYASGGHGFGMKPSQLPVATWPDRLKDWMLDRKLLTP